jgi:hypothetical protein
MTFDPYAAWLDIPADRRPPTYYDLLGISPTECDSNAIEQAALRRLGKVRRFQLGQHGDLSQALATELSRARLVLMDPDRRAAYDESLSDSVPAPNSPTSPAAPPTSVPVAETPLLFTINLDRAHTSPTSDSAVPSFLAGLDSAASPPEAASPVPLFIADSGEEPASFQLRPKRERRWNVKGVLVSAFFISLHIGLFVIFVPILLRRFEGARTPDPVLVTQADALVQSSKIPAPSPTLPPVPKTNPAPASPPNAEPRDDFSFAPQPLDVKPNAPPPEDIAEANSVEPSPPSPAAETSTEAPDTSRSAAKKASHKTNAPQQISLEKAKELYAAARAKLKDTMSKRFRTAKKAIGREFLSNKAARSKWLELIDKERVAFETHEYIPWSIWMRRSSADYLQGVSIANAALDKNYQAEIAAKGDDVDGILQLRAEYAKIVAPWAVARWSWLDANQNKFSHILFSNGKLGDPTGENTWEFTEQGFTVHNGAFTDRCTVNEFGAEFRGENQYGTRFTGFLDNK